MGKSFLRRIPHLLNDLLEALPCIGCGRRRPQFSDDVVREILSRLPAEDVLQCRMVCKNWRSLTSSNYFIKLHYLRGAASNSPVIFTTQKEKLGYYSLGKTKQNEFGYCFTDKIELDFYVCDTQRTNIKKLRLTKELEMNKECCTRLIGSSGGFVAFADECGWSTLFCYFFNLVTQEQFHVCCPTIPGSLGYICGFFYDPQASEFNFLFVNILKGSSQFPEANMCILRGEWRVTDLPSFPYLPSRHSVPAICNRALHWMADSSSQDVLHVPSCRNAIMVFMMDNKRFHALPHPGDECLRRSRGRRHNMMSLLVNKEDEHLVFYDLDTSRRKIQIWTLEDYANWSWERKWEVNLSLVDPSMVIHYHPKKECSLKLLHMQNGELWLEHYREGLFVYHIGRNTVRKLGRSPSKAIGYQRNIYNSIVCDKSLIRTPRDKWGGWITYELSR